MSFVIATQRIPAAIAARTPGSESSSTKQSSRRDAETCSAISR